MADNMSIDKELIRECNGKGAHAKTTTNKKQANNVEVIKEESDDSMDSGQDVDPGRTIGTNSVEGAEPPKRKGGRRPIYATSEERKQRNRQAQAAFRERRSEYIKQLEEAIHVHETNIQSLQAAHRNAADECLMLRYKNSLLERILLEKGIDVQAELYAKTGSPNLGPTHVPQNMVPTPPTMQRAIMNRHHQSRRSTSTLSSSNLAPKSDGGLAQAQAPLIRPKPAISPKTRTKPASHTNSPIDAGAAFGGQTAALSPAPSDDVSVRTSVPPAPMKPQLSPVPMSTGVATPTSRPVVMSPAKSTNPPPVQMPVTTATQPRPPLYPTPSFQNHINELEQEYETGAADLLDTPDMLEDSDLDSPKAPPPYASNAGFGMMPHSQPQPMEMSPLSAGPSRQLPPGSTNQAYPSMTQLLESPGHDWEDPFGLNMMSIGSFPAQFSFGNAQNSMR